MSGNQYKDNFDPDSGGHASSSYGTTTTITAGKGNGPPPPERYENQELREDESRKKVKLTEMTEIAGDVARVRRFAHDTGKVGALHQAELSIKDEFEHLKDEVEQPFRSLATQAKSLDTRHQERPNPLGSNPLTGDFKGNLSMDR